MKRYSALLLLFTALGVLVVSQAGAASPARPTSTFAHPSLRTAGVAAPEEESEAEEGEEELEEEEFEASCGDEAEASKTGKGGAFAPFVSAPAACQVRQ